MSRLSNRVLYPPRFLFVRSNSPYNTAILWPWCFFCTKSTLWRTPFQRCIHRHHIPFKPPLRFPEKEKPSPVFFCCFQIIPSLRTTLVSTNRVTVLWIAAFTIENYRQLFGKVSAIKTPFVTPPPLFLYTLFLLPITPFNLMLYPSWTVTPRICFASLYWWFPTLSLK